MINDDGLDHDYDELEPETAFHDEDQFGSSITTDSWELTRGLISQAFALVDWHNIDRQVALQYLENYMSRHPNIDPIVVEKAKLLIKYGWNFVVSKLHDDYPDKIYESNVINKIASLINEDEHISLFHDEDEFGRLIDSGSQLVSQLWAWYYQANQQGQDVPPAHVLELPKEDATALVDKFVQHYNKTHRTPISPNVVEDAKHWILTSYGENVPSQSF